MTPFIQGLWLDADWLGAGTLGAHLESLVEAPGFLPAAFAIAFLAGAAHAVAPGHGKTLAAAYLVGTEGRIRDAFWLGGSVAVMHTLSALVLAVAWTFFSLSELVGLPELTGWLQLAAGLVAAGVGAWLLWRAVTALREGRDIGHSHGHGHGHGHAQGQGHGHGHGHPPSKPTLVLLGLSGGLVPSPSAFLVLVTGLFVGRSGFALLLVLTFGIGLASVLVVVGLLALGGRNVVARAAESRAALRLVTRLSPLLAGVGITLLGGALTALALGNLA